MNDAPLLVEVADGVATLTLNRAEALNALNGALREALCAALREADARTDVGVIILTGAGRAFCAGLDVKELARSGANIAANVGDADIGATIARTRTPIVAAVNGLAVTGGFEIALCCDIVVAAQSAWFQDTHARIGLLPGWGLSQRLPRVVGPYRAKEISLTARKVAADEAVQLGFVNRVAPDANLREEARALAADIARWSPGHVARIKALIDRGYAMTLADALSFEAREARELNLQVTLPRAETDPAPRV